MNIQQLPVDTVLNQLSLLSERMGERILKLTDHMPIADQLFDIFSMGKGQYNSEISDEVLNPIFDFFENGITYSMTDGATIMRIKTLHSHWQFGNSTTLAYVDKDGNAIQQLISWSESTHPHTRLVTIHVDGDEMIDTLGTSIVSAFTNVTGEAISELSLARETIISMFNKSWNNASEYCSYISDKISKSSNGVKKLFSQIKDVVSTSNDGIDSCGQGLLFMFSNGANNYAVGDSIVHPTEGKWAYNTITNNVIIEGLATAGQIIGTIMMFVGGAVVKVIGAGLSTISTLVQKYNQTVDSGAYPTIKEDQLLPCFIGNTTPVEITYNQVVELIGDITSLPAIVDVGYCRILITAAPAVVNNQPVTKYYFRLYSNCMFTEGSLHDLLEILHRYEPVDRAQLLSTGRAFAQVPRGTVPLIQDVSLRTELQNFTYTHACSQDYFEDPSLTDTQRSDRMKEGYATGWLLFLSYVEGPLTIASPGSSYTELLTCKWPNGFNPGSNTFKSIIRKHLTQTFSDEMSSSLRFNLGTSMWMLTYSLFSFYDYHDSDVPWEAIIDLRNEWFDWLNGTGYYSTYQWFDAEEVSWKTLRFTRHFDAYQVFIDSGTYTTWIVNSDNALACSDYNEFGLSYRTSKYNGCGSLSLVRYYPPLISESLRVFIKVLAITAVVAVAVVTAVYAYKRITRNSRQAKKYVDYLQAVDNYKEDPSRDNLRNLSRASRSLDWDTRLYGSSRFLSVLSGAKFGWGSSDNPSDKISLMNYIDGYSDDKGDVNSLSAINDSNAEIVKLIKG